jgi:hypothetical protein
MHAIHTQYYYTYRHICILWHQRSCSWALRRPLRFSPRGLGAGSPRAEATWAAVQQREDSPKACDVRRCATSGLRDLRWLNKVDGHRSPFTWMLWVWHSGLCLSWSLFLRCFASRNQAYILKIWAEYKCNICADTEIYTHDIYIYIYYIRIPKYTVTYTPYLHGIASLKSGSRSQT